jgi:hypothetical protein
MFSHCVERFDVQYQCFYFQKKGFHASFCVAGDEGISGRGGGRRDEGEGFHHEGNHPQMAGGRDRSHQVIPYLPYQRNKFTPRHENSAFSTGNSH